MENPQPKPGNKLAVILSVSAVMLVFVYVALTNPQTSDMKKETQSEAKTETEVKLPEFDIVKNSLQGITRYIDVVTKSTNDAEIIGLNKALFREYYIDGITHFNIRYFDDRNIALVYNDSVSDPKTTEKESDRLFSHWKYKFTLNKDSAVSELSKNTGKDWKAISE